MMARPGNLLALAVLALLFEQPMHPYEMATTLKKRGKEDSIKLRYGSLYTVIDRLVAQGFIAVVESGRAGTRPERTVYKLTLSGLHELRRWMDDLMAKPAKEYPLFEGALCLLSVLPPDDAVRLLYTRAQRLGDEAAQLERELAGLAEQDLATLTGGDVAPELAAQKFPPLFLVESEYRVAMLKAEIAFIKKLGRRIVEEGWGPVDLWRDIQAKYAQQHVHQARRSEA